MEGDKSNTVGCYYINYANKTKLKTSSGLLKKNL